MLITFLLTVSDWYYRGQCTLRFTLIEPCYRKYHKTITVMKNISISPDLPCDLPRAASPAANATSKA